MNVIVLYMLNEHAICNSLEKWCFSIIPYVKNVLCVASVSYPVMTLLCINEMFDFMFCQYSSK